MSSVFSLSIPKRKIVYSLCVPSMDESITNDSVFYEIGKLALGKILNIVLVPNKHGDSQKAFINFESIKDTHEIITYLNSSKDNHINVFYANGPWFWKVYKSNYSPNI